MLSSPFLRWPAVRCHVVFSRTDRDSILSSSIPLLEDVQRILNGHMQTVENRLTAFIEKSPLHVLIPADINTDLCGPIFAFRWT